MGLKDFFAKKILSSQVVREEIAKRIKEAANPSADIDKDAYLYRPLTAQKDRSLPVTKQHRMQEIAFWLWDSTPLGHRIIEMTKDFVIGDGIKYEVEDAEVKRVLDEFWYDRDNAWDLKQHQRARELSLFGEQFYPVFVNQENGRVKMGYLDPTLVMDVEADPKNPERLIKVKISQSAVGVMDNQKYEYKIVDIDRNPDSPTFEKMVGEIFVFAINTVSTARRGRSDLLAVADWIDIHEKYLFNLGEKAYIQAMFVWEFMFKGWSQQQIDDWVKTHALELTKPAANFYHNENVELSAKNPKLEAQDHADEARLMKNHILSGVAIPEHWVGEGDNTTRATALEMGTPSFKHFKTRQIFFRHMIERIFNFVIDQAIIHQRLKPEVNRSFHLVFPPLTEKDLTEISQSLVNISAALTTGVDEGWIDTEDARKVFKSVVSKLGIELTNMPKPKPVPGLTDEKQNELKKNLAGLNG